MKRLLIFSPYMPPHTGGLESHVEEFAIRLAEHGVSVTVFTSDLGSRSGVEEKSATLTYVRYPAFEIISNFPCPKFWSSSFLRLWRIIRQQHFDYQMTRTRFFLSSLFPFFYGFHRARWIHVEHGSQYVKLRSRFKSLVAYAYDQLFGRLVFFTCADLVVISKDVESFVRLFTRRRTHLIHRGMNIKFMDSVLSAVMRHDFENEKVRIGFVGRLYKWKNVESAIKAVGSLGDSRLEFLVVGDGEDMAELKVYESQSIKMLGGLSREEAIRFLATVHIYIHSSSAGGGLSTSLLEAMYSGCVILATPHEGASEVIHDGENGYLLRSDSVDDIAAGLRRVLENRNKWVELSNNATEYVRKNFEWNGAIEKYSNLLGR